MRGMGASEQVSQTPDEEEGERRNSYDEGIVLDDSVDRVMRKLQETIAEASRANVCVLYVDVREETIECQSEEELKKVSASIASEGKRWLFSGTRREERGKKSIGTRFSSAA